MIFQTVFNPLRLGDLALKRKTMSKFSIEREAAEQDFFTCAAYIAERIGSLDGHGEVVSQVASRYAEKGELDLAAELVNEIADPHTRDINLAEIAAKCVEFDDDEYAFQLAEAIEEFGLQEQAKASIAVRQADKGNFEEALATAEMLADPSSALGEIAIRYAKNGDDSRADATLETVDFPTVRVQVLNEMAAHKAKNGEAEKAVELLDEAVEEIEEIEFPEDKVQLLLDSATKFSAVARHDKAIQTLGKAQAIAETFEDRFHDQFLTQIAIAYAHAGSLDLAEKTLEPIDDLHQVALTHAGIAYEQHLRGDSERAFSQLEEAWQTLKSQPESQVRSSESRFGLWSVIAVRFAQFGKPERGLEIAQSNPEETNYNSALRQIADFCTAQNKDEIAKSALNAIHDFSVKTFALIAVSDAENERGEAEKSVRTLTEAQSVSEEIPQLTLRSRALNEIAVRFAEHGEQLKANEILFESLSVVQQIFDQSHQSLALLHLADAHEKIGTEVSEKESEILQTIIRKIHK